MRRHLTAACLALSILALATTPAQAQSGMDIMSYVAEKANNGPGILLSPAQSFIVAKYLPSRNQYSIKVYVQPCPDGSPYSDLTVFTPAIVARQVCTAQGPQWVRFAVPGVKKNPRGIAYGRTRLRRILEGAQRRVLHAAGCRKRNKAGVFETVHKRCPRMPLASEFKFSATASILTWPQNSCKRRRALDYAQVVYNAPPIDPSVPATPRSSELTLCNGAGIPQSLPPAVPPPPPAPPAAPPAPAPPPAA